MVRHIPRGIAVNESERIACERLRTLARHAPGVDLRSDRAGRPLAGTQSPGCVERPVADFRRPVKPGAPVRPVQQRGRRLPPYHNVLAEQRRRIDAASAGDVSLAQLKAARQ
jgi:hypothetical protein